MRQGDKVYLVSVFAGVRRVRQFQLVVDSGMVIPSKNFTVLHVLHHIYWHLRVEGVGLRQMLDLYFAVKSVDNK